MESLNIFGLANDESNMIVFIGMIIGFFYIFNYLKNQFILFAIFILPGVFMHELAHLIMSFLTRGKPVKFSVIPEKREDRYIMGYVLSANIRWYNAMFIGLAPLLWIPVGYFSAPYILAEQNMVLFIVETYFLATVLYASIPSSQDFKLAIQFSWLPALVILCSTLLYFYGGQFIKIV